MADSLDDFFAKKDKKRGKNRSTAILSSEVLVRELEEGSKQVEYSSRKENKTSAAIEILGLDADDADWRDFEEVDRRDYSGLKVKEMCLQDQAESEQRRPSAEQIDSLPDSSAWKVKEDPASNPSSTINDLDQVKISDPKGDTDISVSNSDSKPPEGSTESNLQATKSEEAKKTGDKPMKYKPPALRNADVHKLEPTVMGRMKASAGRPGNTPDIQDTQMFPSLG